jgi:ribosomal protein S18 acetylase RimI-like enzyme
MGVTVRVAAKDDVPAVLDLWAVGGENASRPDDSAEAVEALIARDPGALILAELDGVLVGSVIAGWDGWRYHLYRLAVHPDNRRQGVATTLLDQAEQRLAELDAPRIDAMVLDDNERGRSVWATRGYDRQPEWSRWSKRLPGALE